jgi:hypothetical protein
MKLDTIIVADAAALAGEKLSILGAFTTHLAPKAFPWSEPSLAIIVRAFLEDGDYERNHVVGVALEAPSGAVVSGSPFNINGSSLKAQRNELAEAEQHAVTLTVTLLGAAFPEPGLYHVVVSSNDVELGRYPLPVLASSQDVTR